MEITVSKDIYSKVGILLIAKGRKIYLDDENLKKFRDRGLLSEILSVENEDSVSSTAAINKISEMAYLFESTHSVQNKKVFNESTKIIEDILYNCRDSSWYSHLKTLANYIDWIYSHSVNTAIISGMLGVQMQYSYEKLYELVLGAILHDIGMILVPTDILKKTGGLCQDEISIINKHSELGAAMISGTGVPEMSKIIILQHHERLDGSGYPNKLTHLEIAEQAQIVMVADSYDAATSYRPYQNVKESSLVIREMHEDKAKYNEKIVTHLKLLLGDCD